MLLSIPVEHQPQLVDYLGLTHSFDTAFGELYLRYGVYLAPLTIALLTAKHCQFGHTFPSQRSGEDVADVGQGNSRLDPDAAISATRGCSREGYFTTAIRPDETTLKQEIQVDLNHPPEY